MTKEVRHIWDEWCKSGELSVQSKKDLIWHIENDPSPTQSISLVVDERIMELVPYIAKHLDHEDDCIRELTVGGVVGRMGMAEYAARALKMARSDPDEGSRALATFSLGSVINKVDPALRKQIAQYLYHVITSEETERYDKSDKRCAFDSILTAMDVPIIQQSQVLYDPNHELVKKFKEKYKI